MKRRNIMNNTFKKLISAMSAAAIMSTSATVGAFAEDGAAADVAEAAQVAQEAETSEAVETAEIAQPVESAEAAETAEEAPVGEYTETADSLSYDLGSDMYLLYSISNGEVCITGNKSASGVVNIPAKIDGYPVTSIGEKAFSSSSVTSVFMPKTMKRIERYAFAYSSTKAITVPNSVEYIGDYCFRDCSYLETVKLGSGLKYLGKYAFANINNYSNKITEITLPASLGEIQADTFYRCKNLATVKIENPYLSKIGSYAFYDCSNLSTISIPTYSELGDYAFYYCKSLKTIDVPVLSQYSGKSIFSDCTNLTSVTIADFTTCIPESLFYNCSSLDGVQLPDTVKTIETSAFRSCTSLTSIEIPKFVNTLGTRCFYNCTSLRDVTLSDNITEILEDTFYNTAIENIVLPEFTKSLGARVFYNCQNLRTVTFPDTVGAIGVDSFYNCSGVTAICNEDTFVAQAASLYNLNVQTPVPGCQVTLKAASVNGSAQLSWNKAYGATQYRIRRKDAKGWSTLATVKGTSYTDATASGTVYYVVIPYINDEFRTEFQSSAAGVKIVAVPPVLTVKTQANKVTVTWNTVKGATKYRIRRNDGTGWTTLQTSKATSYVDNNAVAGKRYTYVVYPFYGSTAGDPSATVKAALVGKTGSAAMSATNTGNGIKISWDKISGVTKYRVRRNDGTGWKTMASTANLSWTDTTAKSGSAYTYVVYISKDGKTYTNPSSTLTIKP